MKTKKKKNKLGTKEPIGVVGALRTSFIFRKSLRNNNFEVATSYGSTWINSIPKPPTISLQI